MFKTYVVNFDNFSILTKKRKSEIEIYYNLRLQTS